MTEETTPLLSNRSSFTYPITNIPDEIIDKILDNIPEAYNTTIQISKRFADRSRKINYARAASIWINQIVDIQNSKYWLPDIVEYDNHINAAYTNNINLQLSDHLSKSSLYRYSPLYRFLRPPNLRNTLSPKWCPTLTVSLCRDPCIFTIGILVIIGLFLFTGLYIIPQHLITVNKLYTDPGENSDVQYSLDNSKSCIANVMVDYTSVPAELTLICQAWENIKWGSRLSAFRNNPHFHEYFNNTRNWLVNKYNNTDKDTVIHNDTVYYASVIKLKLEVRISTRRWGLDIILYLYQYSRECLIEYGKKNANLILAGEIISVLFLFVVFIVMFIHNYYNYRIYHL